MKEICLDIGTIQAFLDGELETRETTRVTGHIALCDQCSFLLSEAEDQSAVVFSTLEREFNTLVPTQRLWNKINESIATERKSRSFWQKALAFASLAFANPSIAAAAGLLIVVGVFAAVWMNRTPLTDDVARGPAQGTPIAAPSAVLPVRIGAEREVRTEPPTTAKFEPAVYRADYRQPSPRTAGEKAPVVSGGYLPGEESYVKTIASLTKTVEEDKAGGIMRPGERISYERDMAVVNDAIVKMKQEVKRNPRNESAKQVLYSSYQNKIDLLNSVSQKEELMARLK